MMTIERCDGSVAVLRDPGTGLVTMRTVLPEKAIASGTLGSCFTLYELGSKHGFGINKPSDITIEALRGDMIISVHISTKATVEFQNQVYRRFVQFLTEAGLLQNPICCKIKIPFGAAPLH